MKRTSANKIRLPLAYPFAEVVPKQGASCATCYFLDAGGPYAKCSNRLYIKANGGDKSLGASPRRWCCMAWAREPR